jgi:hypothetical protein
MVHVSTSIRGNVKYFTQELESDHITPEGERKARWETERTIADPQEHERAVKARSAARSVIQGVCIQSSAFGLSCPEAKSTDLDAAITEAERIAAAFNTSATVTRLGVYIAVGRVAEDDERAIRAINNNVRELMDAMADGMRNLDVETIRDAANKARALGGMLTDGAKDRVQEAIEVARKAARAIVSAGEQGAAEVDRLAIQRITEARTAFLDLDDNGQEVQAPTASARSVDFEPESNPPVTAAAPAQSRMFEL